MGKRIVTTDVEIIDAVIKVINKLDAEYGDITTAIAPAEAINEAARDVVHILTKPPEKPSDITGFEDDDAEDIE